MSGIRKLNCLILLLLLASLLWAGGCKQPIIGSAAKDKYTPGGKDQKGYLYSTGGVVMFVRWTEINKKLNGQLSIFYSTGSRGKSTDASSHPFEGVFDGESVSLNFTGSIWSERLSGKTWTGSIKGDELTLVIPTKSGLLESLKFKAATVEEYNQIVFGIKQDVQIENTRIRQEEAEAAKIRTEKNAVITGNERVKTSIDELVALIRRLEGRVRFDDVLSNYSQTWENMKINHNELREKAAEKPLTSFRLGKVEHILGRLQHDIGTFEHHSGTLEHRIVSVNDAINDVKEAADNIRISWEFLGRAVAANSTGTPTSQFSENDISQSLHLAEERIQKALRETQQASRQKVSFEGQAKDLYRKAESFVKSLKAMDQ